MRAGLTCTGYRDPGQLRIRDESESTKNRALGSKSRSIGPSIQVPLGDMARAAFFSHYVIGFSKTYDMLELIGRQAELDKHLAASVDAVSLAFFSFQYDAATALEAAREKYLSTLPLIKSALGAPEVLVTNSTLLAVLFLDLFEKIINRSPVSPDSWMSHVRGALALVELRDPAQLNTYVGLRLSVRLFTNMLISCVAARTSIPPALMKLHSDLQLHVNQDDPKWQVSSLVLKYANFQGAVQNGLPPSETLFGAKRLDGDFASLAKHLPASWISYRVPVRKESSQTLEKYYDVHPDHFTAQTVNLIRLMRILLNDLIRSVYSKTVSLFPDSTLQASNVVFAGHIIDTMAKDICATGPQFTGTFGASTRPTHSSPARKLHCYTLLFPFYVAAHYASYKSGVRDWVVPQLKNMSTKLGLRNADMVAEMLERHEDVDPWTVYAMLGSYAFAA